MVVDVVESILTSQIFQNQVLYSKQVFPGQMIPQKPSLSGEGRPFSHPKIEARHKKRIAIFMLFCSLPLGIDF